MRSIKTIRPRFVDAIPSTIQDGILYVSTAYATAVHKCCCGCGKEVVTPLGPTDWKIVVAGESVSLYPSIGNWSFDCKSHYWIDRGHVRSAEPWTEAKVRYGRQRDRIAKQRHYGESPRRPDLPPGQSPQPGWVISIRAWFRRLFTGW